jgi:cellulose synthase (UDP-forming)
VTLVANNRVRHRSRLAAWTRYLDSPAPEPAAARRLARAGGVVAVGSLVLYLSWRVLFTLPPHGPSHSLALVLIVFEALPLAGIALKVAALWNIDCAPPDPTMEAKPGKRVAVLIPTYNEPAEVVGPTIATAVDIDPAHETWVLDDGDRPWLVEMCEAYGARYVSRCEHDHAKAGNLNNALALMADEEAGGAPAVDIVAVLDCDHVPLNNFLTATLGWFDDPEIALVQAPQTYYNGGAYDDDGFTGEQGLFFNVQMPARQHAGAGPFWCGSTSLLRVRALRDVGGVATETVVEDVHTTLKLTRAGWKTAYHHQAVAVGVAPATSEQYLLQRRRWGMGAMQVLVKERLLTAKSWLSWRNYYEYLAGTLWWLEGIATVAAFMIPVAILLSGAHTSTAPPLTFAAVFTAMFSARLWGTKRLLRKQIRWPTAFALRILRVPVGLSCVWWLVTRRSLSFQVTPKGAFDDRVRGRVPAVIWMMNGFVAAVIGYAAAGIAGVVPWRTPAASAVASGVWLVFALVVLAAGTARIRANRFATSRRNAYRVRATCPVVVDGIDGELVDISVGGAAVRFPGQTLPLVGMVQVALPGAMPVKMSMARLPHEADGHQYASLQVPAGDWEVHRVVALWMFHTPDGVVPELPPGTPLVALV